MRFASLFAAGFLALTPAYAHEGFHHAAAGAGFAEGFMHPLGGADHMMALALAGMIAALLWSNRHRALGGMFTAGVTALLALYQFLTHGMTGMELAGFTSAALLMQFAGFLTARIIMRLRAWS